MMIKEKPAKVPGWMVHMGWVAGGMFVSVVVRDSCGVRTYGQTFQHMIHAEQKFNEFAA